MGLQRVKHDRATEQQHGNFMFNFLRNHQSVLQSSCTILYPHKPYTRVSISSHPCQHLLHSTLFIIAILLDIKWYFMVLTCISLMTIDVEHLLDAYLLFADILPWVSTYFSKDFFFLTWTIFKVFIESVTILLLLVLFWSFGPTTGGILTPLTEDWTITSCIVTSQPLDRQGST